MTTTKTLSRNELAVAIAGGRTVSTRQSHERIENEARQQLMYIQGRMLICKTSTLEDAPKAVKDAVTASSYNRSTFKLTGEAANIKTAKAIVEAAAKSHSSKAAPAAPAKKAAPKKVTKVSTAAKAVCRKRKGSVITVAPKSTA